MNGKAKTVKLEDLPSPPKIDAPCTRCEGSGRIGDGGHPHNGSGEIFEGCRNCAASGREVRNMTTPELASYLFSRILEDTEGKKEK
jgi:hypothetical protein